MAANASSDIAAGSGVTCTLKSVAAALLYRLGSPESSRFRKLSLVNVAPAAWEVAVVK